jgi:anaerobic selenocysteine-containing dehydrogenase
VVAVLSPHATNEENETLASMVLSNYPKALLTALPAPRAGEDIRYKSGFTICAERAANAMGVKRIMEKFPERAAGLGDVLKMAQAGELFAVYMLNGDPEQGRPAGELASLRKARFVVAHDIFPSELALLADVVFPGAACAEKSGSFTNITGYIQDFEAALAPPGNARRDVEVLEEVQKMLSVPALR